MGMECTSVIFALSILQVCSCFHPEKGTRGALQQVAGGQTFPSQHTQHFQNVSKPGPVCLCKANALISSWLHFETSQLTIS